MPDDPLPLLLESYEKHGPIFTLRLFHGASFSCWAPRPTTTSPSRHAANFHWREGHFRELIGLLGDGLLTIDGDFHRRSRRIMLPAFHRERIAASIDTMIEETDLALRELRPGASIDLYAWTRKLALRIAMRALFGLDPDGAEARSDRRRRPVRDGARLLRHRISGLRMLRGPGTPWQRQQRAARELDGLIYAEIARRRRTGERGMDVLSLLLDASDEDGNTLSDLQIRDEVMTLLFAGHDTTTSTVSFMFYELGPPAGDRRASASPSRTRSSPAIVRPRRAS